MQTTNRTRRVTATAIVASFGVVLALLGTPQAQAAPSGEGTYHIAAGGFFVSAVREAFRLGVCQPAIADSPLNGTDVLIVDVASLAGQKIRLDWSGTVHPVLGLSIAVHSATCSAIPPGGSVRGSTTTVQLPSTAKWLILTPEVAADVEVTLTAIPT